MAHMRLQPHIFIEEKFPGQVLSYKAHVAKQGLSSAARIVYLHGKPKQPDLMHLEWVSKNWR